MPTPHIDENVMDRYAMGTLPDAAIPPVEEHLLCCSSMSKPACGNGRFCSPFPRGGNPGRTADSDVLAAIPERAKVRLGRFRGGGRGVSPAMVSGEPRLSKAQPAMVLMQSLRGPEEAAQIAKGSPSLLIFDVGDTCHAPELRGGSGGYGRPADSDGAGNREGGSPRLPDSETRARRLLGSHLSKGARTDADRGIRSAGEVKPTTIEQSI